MQSVEYRHFSIKYVHITSKVDITFPIVDEKIFYLTVAMFYNDKWI